MRLREKEMNKGILVTGSHRSGTTWVGKILSLAQNVEYANEPFNPKFGLRFFKTWFKYIKEDKEAEKEIQKLLQFKGNFRFNLPALKYWSNRFSQNKVVLIKDPIACFSSDWLSSRFNIPVLVIFRHPAAFYASLKRLDWHFDFQNLLSQKELMADHLEPLRGLMEKEKSFAEEAATLWLCLYTILDKYIQKNKNWIVKRHEDISLNPVEEFKDIYQRLDLKFTKEIEKEIEKHSQGKVETRKELELNRNSKELIQNWKKHVTEEELKTILSITKEISQKYYP